MGNGRCRVANTNQWYVQINPQSKIIILKNTHTDKEANTETVLYLTVKPTSVQKTYQLPTTKVFTTFHSEMTLPHYFSALYGVLFHGHKEAAFANYRLWESMGYVIAFVCSSFLCVDIKLYMLLAVLLLSVTLCCVVEYQEYRNPTPGVEDVTSAVSDEKNTVDLNMLDSV